MKNRFKYDESIMTKIMRSMKFLSKERNTEDKIKGNLISQAPYDTIYLERCSG